MSFELDYRPFPLPVLSARPSLLPFLADHHLPYIVPAVVFWLISLTFHYIDTRCLLSAYKLHTTAEDLKKNHASRRDVIKFAVIQQVAQCTLGYLMADDTEQFPSDEYGIVTWALRIHYVRHLSTCWMRFLGFASDWIINESKRTDPAFNQLFIQNLPSHRMGNISHTNDSTTTGISTFSQSEWAFAEVMYWMIVPLLQFIFAMVLADTFQYFTHRAFHVNKWLYKHIHSMHHDINVPFAYGAFYNHPLETIPIDGIGFPICLMIAGLNNRQAALFGAIWTFKTVVDHCGYDFPYNPCNIVCPQSALFHDLHHQSWGMKYNFSVYGSFWDWVLGTYWSPRDSKAQDKYKRGKEIAEAWVTQDVSKVKTVGYSSAVDL